MRKRRWLGEGASSQERSADVCLFEQDFEADPVGPYSRAMLAAAWKDPPWQDGIDEGRVAVVSGDEAYGGGRSLRVAYPKGAVGPREGGAQWKLFFGTPAEEAFVRYRLRFAPRFEFVLGGKLPGLAGGSHNTGGGVPSGRDGFSARMMWRQGGNVVQYVYHPDQQGFYGDDFAWDANGQRSFVPGVWHTVEHHLVLNTPGRRDGLLEGWFDGELALRRADLRFRDVGTIAIDILYFSTFFGGSGIEWAPTKDEFVDFADFAIARERIGI